MHTNFAPSEITSRGKHFQEKGNLDISYVIYFCSSQMWRRAVCRPYVRAHIPPYALRGLLQSDRRFTVWPVSWDTVLFWFQPAELVSSLRHPILSQLGFVHLSSAWQDGRFFFGVFTLSRPGQIALIQKASSVCPACAGPTSPDFHSTLTSEWITHHWVTFFSAVV